jgi:hypothetical protein
MFRFEMIIKEMNESSERPNSTPEPPKLKKKALKLTKCVFSILLLLLDRCIVAEEDVAAVFRGHHSAPHRQRWE